MSVATSQSSRPQSRFSFHSWATSFVGACLLTLLIALLLALAHRTPHYEAELETQPIVSIQTVDLPPQAAASSSAAPAAAADFSSILPPIAILRAPPVNTDAPPMETSMELSAMIQWHYSFAEIGQASQATGTFGQSSLSSLDGGIETILIPPEQFPQSLIDAGIFKGNVVITLIIDKDGHAKVKSVHSASHPELIDPVVKSMNRAIYSTPEKDGRPTSTVIRRNVIFQADAKRIDAHLHKYDL